MALFENDSRQHAHEWRALRSPAARNGAIIAACWTRARIPTMCPCRLSALGWSGHWGKNAGGGTEDDCAASFRGSTLRAFLRGGSETGPDRDGDDLSCMMSCSAACSVAMFWAICSCLAASCSTLFRITARSRAPRAAPTQEKSRPRRALAKHPSV